MLLDKLYYLTYSYEEPFSGDTTHLSGDFLVSTFAADISYKSKLFNLPLAPSDALDNLYYKLTELDIDPENFLNLLYFSQNEDVDKYLITTYGYNCEMFIDLLNVFAKSPKMMKKYGLQEIPHNLNPEEISYAVEFFTLLNYEALINEINKADFTKAQKIELISFFESMQNKPQYEYNFFDYKISNDFHAKSGIRKMYDNIIACINLPLFTSINYEVIAEIAAEEDEIKETITSSDRSVVAVVEPKTTGITLDSIKKIRSFMVGQDEAVEKITARLMAAAIGLRDENKPLCSLLLDGPTGVGKTELAKAIAKACFNGALHIEDMTQYKNKADVSRLTGSSAGYVGYGDTPAIVTFLSSHEGGVLLFDEVDKCDPACLDILMRIMDEGEFKNAKGEVFSTKNMVIVMTTNMSEYVEHKQVGFNLDAPKQNEHAKSLAESGTFRKEVLGRVDEVIKFKKLTKEECEEIAFRYLFSHASKFNKNHSKDKVKLVVTHEFIEDIIEDSNFRLFGGRDIISVARKHFDATIVSYYLSQKVVKDKILLVLGKNNVQEVTRQEFQEFSKSKEM